MKKIIGRIYGVLILGSILPTVIAFAVYMDHSKELHKSILIPYLFWDTFLLIWLSEIGIAAVVGIVWFAVICLNIDP